MKYLCENCGYCFSKPRIHRETYWMGGPWYDEIMICPRCRVDGMMEELEDDCED